MNVACLVPYALGRVPGQRFRLEQWAPHLKKQGVHLDFIPLLNSATMDYLYLPGHQARKARALLAGCIARINWALREAQKYDVVVVHREALLFGVDWIERYLSRRVPTVFDFDDAVWYPNYAAVNRRFGFLKGFAKIDRILRMVSAVSAGCEYLANYARQRNHNTFVVPTSIELETYSPPRVHQSSSVLTVGWTGSYTTGAYLELLREPLRQASRRFPMKMVVVGAQVELPGVTVRYEPWNSTSEVPLLRTFDIGLKPTAQEEWAKGKCPMKDIQYMALGIPPIATRFGTATESIEHGVSGLLCENDTQWIESIDRLRSVEERRRMGAAARQVVEQRYSATVASAQFRRVLDCARTQFR